MRKGVLVIFLVLLIGVASGCLGGSKTTSQTSSQTTAINNTFTSTSMTTRTTTTTSQNPLETLKGSLKDIKQFTYRGKSYVHMNVTVLMSNFTQNNTIALSMKEAGYLDFSSMEAIINTTTITEPDNTTLKTIKVIKDGKTYLKTIIGPGVGSLNITNNVSSFIWDYNPISLAKRYISSLPDKVVKNGESTQLVYTLNWQDVRALAIPYLAVTKDTGIKVKSGKLTLQFKGDRLTGIYVEYSVIATSVVKDPLLGQMTIEISAKGTSNYEITSINKKMKVEPPT